MVLILLEVASGYFFPLLPAAPSLLSMNNLIQSTDFIQGSVSL